jgi:hypothetical protein
VSGAEIGDRFVFSAADGPDRDSDFSRCCTKWRVVVVQGYSSKFGFVLGHGRDQLVVSTGILHSCSNHGRQTVTACRRDNEGGAEVGNLFSAAIGQVPCPRRFSWQFHLPSI